MSAAITKVKDMAIVFKTFMMTNFIPNMIASLRSTMASLGGKILSLFQKLVKIAQVFRLLMVTTFIPSMIGAFTGMMAAMTPILVALAPILLPILAIAAAFGLVLLGLNKIKESMGFTSIFDVIMYGVSFIKDGLAHLGNVFIKIAKKVAGLGAGLLEVIGIDVPDWVYKARDMELMATDNAARKKVELDQKAEAARLEKKESESISTEPTKQTFIPEEIVPISPNLQSDVLATSQENAQGQSATTTQAIVTSVTQQNNASSSSSSSTIINPTGNSMAAMELAGATGGRR
jgi:hypothetical protein